MMIYYIIILHVYAHVCIIECVFASAISSRQISFHIMLNCVDVPHQNYMLYCLHVETWYLAYIHAQCHA